MENVLIIKNNPMLKIAVAKIDTITMKCERILET